MHTHPTQGASRTPALIRSGVTASAAAFVLAGFATPAAAHEPAEDEPQPVTLDDAAGEQPPEDAVLHEVQPGEYLASIAAAYDLDPENGWRLIFDANPQIADPDLITAGQQLRIPAPDEELEQRPLPGTTQPAPAPQTETATQGEVAPQQVTPQPEPAPAPDPAPSTTAGVWDSLAQCESGGNWSANTGNGFYGGLQFSLSSWQAVGGAGYPHEASRAEQIQRGEQLRAVQGWGAWPSCSSQLGLR